MDIGAEIQGQYRVVEHIGRGGMADVWSARDTRLNRLVAIKTIQRGLMTDADPLRLFRHEAQTIARLEHPHILPIYDFGDYQGSLYIVMRFVTGGSLDDLLRQGPMTSVEALAMGRNIALALDYAHDRNIIHLDLKPPNILLDSSRSPYLADFGLATVLDPEGRARNPGSGTPLYMAPEQLTSELIDRRADIYSFSIMLYHMLTGRMPFGGGASLALRQIQYQDQLPAATDAPDALPQAVVEVLRRGTAFDPAERPENLAGLVDQLSRILLDSGPLPEPAAAVTAAARPQPSLTVEMAAMDTQLIGEGVTPELLEAVHIYQRARQEWAGGQGRFLLGLTHFMLISDHYINARQSGLSVDRHGRQMLLRGAIEYNYHLDYWWRQLDDDQRRWVCLHVVRSGTPPARVRAMARLEDLPDAARPVIPRLVAQALESETDQAVRLAALHLLGQRADTMAHQPEYDFATGQQTRLLRSMARLGLALTEPSVWRDVVFSPQIDHLIAGIALNDPDPQVAQTAARVIGRIHSLQAVRFIADAQREGQAGALQVLALIRDEALSLPDTVAPQARLYSWLTNTLRRLVDRPLDGILRLLLVLLGGWIAMGEQVYITFRSQALFTPQRWGNTIAIGLVFGLFVAAVVALSDELPRRMRGFWAGWLRLLLGSGLGWLMGMLTWAGFTWFFLQTEPDWELMRLGGFGLAFGFVMTAMLGLRGWQAWLLPVLSIFIPIYGAFYNFCQQTFICMSPAGDPYPPFNFLYVPLLALAVGLYLALRLQRPGPADVPIIPLDGLPRYLLSLVLALTWNGLVWLVMHHAVTTAAITWDGITGLFLVALVLVIAAVYLLEDRSRWLFAGASAAVFGLVYVLYGAPAAELPLPASLALLYYDRADQIFSVALPFAAVIAFSAYGHAFYDDLRALIGLAGVDDDRDPWLVAALVYARIMGLIIAVLAPFSAHVRLDLALFWGLWGLALYVFAQAAHQWWRWGGRGLMLCVMLTVPAGFVMDVQHTIDGLRDGAELTLLSPEASLLASLWALLASLLAWGVMRRQLWAGIGLIAAIAGWLLTAIFIPVPSSMAVLAMLNTALVAYALRPSWSRMVAGWSLSPEAEAEVAPDMQAMDTVMGLFEADEAPTREQMRYMERASTVVLTESLIQPDPQSTDTIRLNDED